MASRVISYVFKGEFGSLSTGLRQTGKQTDDAKRKLKELELAAKKSQGNLAAFKGGMLDSLGLGAAAGPQAIGIAAAAGIAAVVGTAAKFDQAMSNVRAATHETAGNMEELRAAALKAGSDTVYSATESAGAIEELAKAGVSTKDILGGGLNGALSLAAAGALDVGEAAEVAASAMTQFGLAGDQVPHIADLLAAGAGKAQGSVHDLGMALNQSGLVASQMGVSIEEATGTLAAFASAGLTGSDAGTSFKTMLLRLANPSKEAADTMRALNISAYDAQGNFVGIRSLAGQLSTAFKGQSQAQRDAAMATIFGSDAIRAANVLYTDGSDGIQQWTDAVNDSGYAAETAATRLDNLAGDWEKLQGSIETALIQSGDNSQGPLRSLTQGATGAVDAFNGLDEGIRNSFFGLAGTWSNVKSMFGDSKKQVDESAVSSDEAAAALQSYTGELNAAGVAADGTSMDVAGLVKSMQDQRKAALGAFDAVTQYGQALADARKRARETNAGINASTKAGRENRQALSQLAAAWNNQSDAVRNNSAKFRAARSDFIQTATAMGVPRAAAKALARQLLDIPDSVVVHVNANTGAADSAISHINDRMNALNGKHATTYIDTIQRSFNEKRAGIPTNRATGGYISGPGTTTSDSIPAYLSNGEYVVKASAVAKYGVAMFDSLNAQHFASGGSVGNRGDSYFVGPGMSADAGLPGIGEFLHGIKLANASLKQLKAAVERSEKAIDKEKSKRDDLVSARNDLKGSVSGTFQHDIFGNGVAGALTQLQADSNDANAMRSALARAGKNGLDTHGSLYAALAQSGDLNTAQQLAGMSRAQIDQLEAAYANRTRATGALGGDVANNQYGAQIAKQTATIARLEKVHDRLEKAIKNLRHDVKDGARQGTREGNDDRNRNTSARSRAGR